jgi:zinc/manganese transport system substrate-binding protein
MREVTMRLSTTLVAAAVVGLAAPASLVGPFVLEAQAKLAVVATTSDLAALARAVGGADTDVRAIARPTEDPHFVDAKPSYAKLLNGADLLIDGGAALESGWLPPLLDAARNPKLAPGAAGRVVAAAGIGLLEVPTTLSRAQGDVHPLGNPHYLLDPGNGGIAAATIADAMATVDPGNAERYRANLARFRSALESKLAEWDLLMKPHRGLKLVTYHKSFDYLAKRFGLEIVGMLEPKPGIPPSPAYLAELIPRMRAAKVQLILIEPNRERQVPDFVAEKTGARVLALPIMPGVPEAPEYLDLIDHDLKEIAAAAAGGS